jgi:hypothetical protein
MLQFEEEYILRNNRDVTFQILQAYLLR